MMATLGAPADVYAQGAKTAVAADQGMRASRLIGQTVIGDHGGDLCTVEDVLMKPGGGEPTVIVSVTSTGTPGKKLIALPLNKIRIEGQKPKLAGFTPESLQRMPTFVFDGGSG
jgi:sporulation protein YlmC with PRC-barrel domain